VLAAEKVNHLVAHDLDKLLLGREALEHILTHRLGFDRFEESLNDLDMDVGLKQGEADVTQGVIDVFLGDFALAPKPFKGQLELIG
jgi:hypothetical protein